MNLLDALDPITSALRRALRGLELDKRQSGEIVVRTRVQNGGVIWVKQTIENISVEQPKEKI